MKTINWWTNFCDLGIMDCSDINPQIQLMIANRLGMDAYITRTLVLEEFDEET